jgi:uncharacterized protein with HEPN domain
MTYPVTPDCYPRRRWRAARPSPQESITRSFVRPAPPRCHGVTGCRRQGVQARTLHEWWRGRQMALGSCGVRRVPFDTLTQAVEDILEHIARIERFVASVDEVQFRNDERTVFAVHCAVSAISGVAVRLGDWADVLSGDVPWDRLRDLSGQLRPGYDRIDSALLWSVVVQDLAPLRLSAMRALNWLEDHERLEWL